jgi:signal transduction histidine kinase
MDTPSSRLSGRRPFRANWALALLLIAVGITGVAAVQVGKSELSHRQTAGRLLHDYAAFAAWTYSVQSGEAFAEMAWRVLSPIQHQEMHLSAMIPDASSLPKYFIESVRRYAPDSTWPPATYFAFRLGADTLKTVGRTFSPEMRHWVLDTIRTTARGVSPMNDRETYIFRKIDGQTRMISYALMPVPDGAIVYGFEFDERRIRSAFETVLTTKTLLPASLTQGERLGNILAVQVTAPGGLTLYESKSLPDWDYYAEDTLGSQFGGVRVRLSVQREMAPRLIIGGLPRSRLPLLVSMLVLATALSVMSVIQLRREERLARARSEFVSSVSHELRTPLAQIRLFLETLRLGRFTTEEQRQWSLRNIDRETNRLAHLVENVLHFARAGQSTRAPAPGEPTDLAVEIEQTARAFEPLAASRRVTIARELEPDVLVPLRREDFRQVLLNLFDNAVKYGPPGQTVTVSMQRSGATAVVRVRDEGPGIPRREREAIWRAFFRGSEPGVQAVGGSGIGLAIVRDIVERLGGRISLEDTSRGASFAIELPLASAATAEAPTPADPSPGAAAPLSR